MEQGLTILLKQDQASGEWYCPMNRKHKTSNDVKSV